MHTNLKLEIDKSDTLDSIGFEEEELDYWLNSAIKTLVKTKYSGSGSSKAFEQNQKRIDDLRTLVYEDDITVTRGILDNDKPNSYKALLSSTSQTYWFALSEEIDIVYQSGTTTVPSGSLEVGSTYLVDVVGTPAPVLADLIHDGTDYHHGDYFLAANANYTIQGGTTVNVYLCTSLRQGISETTSDTYRQEIDNPYSEHVFENNKAKPLRLFNNLNVELITDGNYGVFTYYLRYLKEPRVLEYNVTDSDLPEHTHDEVVKLAAKMILENTENPRYRTYLNEISGTE